MQVLPTGFYPSAAALAFLSVIHCILSDHRNQVVDDRMNRVEEVVGVVRAYMGDEVVVVGGDDVGGLDEDVVDVVEHPILEVDTILERVYWKKYGGSMHLE